MAQLNPLLVWFVNGLRDQILGPAYCKRCRFQQVVAGLPTLEPRLEPGTLLLQVGKSLVGLDEHRLQPSQP
jgi:hypothetical protein